MNRQIASQTHQQKSTATPLASGLLKRKHDFGPHTIAGGELGAYSKKKRLGLQTKLKVNEPGDIYEQEADRVADQVMAMPANSKVGDVPRSIQRLSGEPTRQRGTAPASVDQALASPGRPLEPSLRQDMEQRFGYDFSQIRVHTDAKAAESARAVNARAYTIGRNIVFGSGQFSPHNQKGQILLAHELTHVIQQSSADNCLVQRDLESDFAGRESVSVSNVSSRPPGSLRVTTPEGDVYAPYRIYRPNELPVELHSLSMRSREAETYRAAETIGSVGSVPAGHVSVGHLARYQEAGPTGIEVRVMIARVNGQYRLVGFDSSVRGSTRVTQGWVEGATGTRGAGVALLVNRIHRALRNQVETIHAEMGFSPETESFHRRVFEVAGIEGSPQDQPNYRLTVRRMIRILVRWDEGLSDSQRSALRRLAEGQAEPTVQQARAILIRGLGGSGGGGAAPGSPGSPPPAGGSTSASSGARVRSGEYVVRNGEWFEVVERARPGESVVQLRMGGQIVRAVPIRVAPAGGVPRGLAIRGGGVLGALAILAGEALHAGARVMAVQRESIERGQQEIAMWDAVGASPIAGLWDPDARRPAPPGAHARTSVDFSEEQWFGTHYWPYVVDIDVGTLTSQMPSQISIYQDFATFMDIAQALGAIEQRDDRYFAVVNRVGGARRSRDITAIIIGTRAQVLRTAGSQMRAALAEVPEAQQTPTHIVRIRQGANIFRSAHGPMPRIINASEHLGQDPWVRIVDRAAGGVVSAVWHGHYADRLRVEPVNADAYRAASYARYYVRGSLPDVWRQVRDYGRPVTPSAIPSGRFDSFVAGPHPTETRFGTTTYTRDPIHPGMWTIATGELRTFWVDADDVEPVTDQEIGACLRSGVCRR
jgi:hypothetical protein